MGFFDAVSKRNKALEEATEDESSRIEKMKSGADKEAKVERKVEKPKSKKCPVWVRPEDCKK